MRAHSPFCLGMQCVMFVPGPQRWTKGTFGGAVDCSLPGHGHNGRRLRGARGCRVLAHLALRILHIPRQVWKYSSSYAHMRTCLEIALTKSWTVAQSYDEMCRRDWHARAKRGELRAARYVALCLVGVACLSAGGRSFDVNSASMNKDQAIYDRVVNALGSSAGAQKQGAADADASGKQGATCITLVAISPLPCCMCLSCQVRQKGQGVARNSSLRLSSTDAVRLCC